MKQIPFRIGSGGRTPVPEVDLFCCHCRKRLKKGEFETETNWESPVYNQLSCSRCFEGPPPSRVPQIFGPEDVGPEPINWWL